MISTRLLAQLMWVAQRDADAIRDDYAWPRKVLTAEEREESDRLEAIARELDARVTAAGQATGTDYCFGDEEG